ncbi:MAG: Cof-type HAD-IIB family hydrolase [Candidatus Tectimicrobiota bacterium]
MDIRLVALDLDGTLLTKDHRLTPAMEAAVGAARARGYRIILATNRLETSAQHFARRLGLTAPLISYGGALVRSLNTSPPLLDLRLEREVAQEALRALDGEEVFRFVYQNGRVYTDQETWYSVRYGDILGVTVHLAEDLEAILDAAPTAVVFRSLPEEAPRLTDHLATVLDGRARILNSLPYYIEVLPREATKGRALKALLEHYGLGPEHCLAIGDGLNDLDMIACAGVGVAVANADERLKAAADYVTANPRERGVFEALMRWCGIALEGEA